MTGRYVTFLSRLDGGEKVDFPEGKTKFLRGNLGVESTKLKKARK